MNAKPRQVMRALRAIRQSPDTRALKREFKAGNPYVEKFLARRGLVYDREAGAIRAVPRP